MSVSLTGNFKGCYDGTNLKKRDFLKENIQRIRIKSEILQRLKNFSPKSINSEPKTINKKLNRKNISRISSIGGGGGDGPNVFERLNKKNFQKQKNEIKLKPERFSIKTEKKRFLKPSPRAFHNNDCQNVDKYIQTSENINDEEFTENAVIIEPSLVVLKKIRDDKERQLTEDLNKKLKERRIFGKGSEKFEIHLTDYTEYLEKGSVSRRKSLIKSHKEEIKKLMYNQSFLSNLRKTIDEDKSENHFESSISRSDAVDADGTFSKIPVWMRDCKIDSSEQTVNVEEIPSNNNENENNLIVLYQKTRDPIQKINI